MPFAFNVLGWLNYKPEGLHLIIVLATSHIYLNMTYTVISILLSNHLMFGVEKYTFRHRFTDIRISESSII